MATAADGLPDEGYDMDSEPWFARTVAVVRLTPAEIDALRAHKRYLGARFREIRARKKAAVSGHRLTSTDTAELRTLKRRSAVLFAEQRAKDRVVAKHRLNTGERLERHHREAMGRGLILWQLAAWVRRRMQSRARRIGVVAINRHRECHRTNRYRPK